MSERKNKPEKIKFDHILNEDGSSASSDDDGVMEVFDGGGDETPPGGTVAEREMANDPGAQAIEKLLEEALQEKEEYKDLYLRSRADFENLKKRVDRDRQEQRIQAAASVVEGILPALDNLQLALEQAEDQPAIHEGLLMIQKQIMDALGKVGVEPVDALGEPFDPSVHEAMAAEERSDFAPNTIIEEIRKGYTLGGRVVRPSLVKVVVAATRAASEREGGTGESDGTDHRD